MKMLTAERFPLLNLIVLLSLIGFEETITFKRHLASAFNSFPVVRRRAFLRATSSTTGTLSSPATAEVDEKDRVGSGIFVVSDTVQSPSPFGSKSPVDNPTWIDAASHLALKSYVFSNGSVDFKVLDLSAVPHKDVEDTLIDTNVVIAMGLESHEDVNFLKKVFEKRREISDGTKLHFAIGSSDEIRTQLRPLVGAYDETSVPLVSGLPWTLEASGKRLQELMEQLFCRYTSDDFCVALILFFNLFVAPMDWVKYSVDATWEKGPVRNAQEFISMATKCGDCIGRCLADEQCKTCLGALTEVDTRDQVASYRTIVSFESELLKDFSFCILQKNNVFQCNAQIPTILKVPPMTSWRGKPLTVEDGQTILVGHLDDEDASEGTQKLDVSWKVAAGANVAYDQFPSQNQLFYKSTNGRSMWYDPVFRVETIDGRSVWCKRHYKVRIEKVPGTYRLSVLDNGVTSNEFWTIVGAADDLSWIVFHYAGAAAAVGQQYMGGLLCTPDGSLPPGEKQEEIWGLFRSAGIQPWELFVVDNNMESPKAQEAGPAPLDYYRNSGRDAVKTKK